MNPELRRAKEECNKAYNEYMKASQVLCQATTKEQKKAAQENLFNALDKFNEAQQKVISLKLNSEKDSEED